MQAVETSAIAEILPVVMFKRVVGFAIEVYAVVMHQQNGKLLEEIALAIPADSSTSSLPEHVIALYNSVRFQHDLWNYRVTRNSMLAGNSETGWI